MELTISEDNLPPGIPPEAIPHLRAVGYFRPSPTKVGDQVPELTLFTPQGEAAPFRELYREKPAVLVFGSYT